MGSISYDPKTGRRAIQFVAGDGKRRSIRLGKVAARIAEEICRRVETLNTAGIAGMAIDGDTAAWLDKIGPDLHAKLAGVGLVQARAFAKLGDFLDGYVAKRSDVKPNTTRNLEVAKARLIAHFGRDRNPLHITPADADAFALSLRETYASATVGRTVRRAKQFFRAAVRAKLIKDNPFADVKAPGQSNPARKFFITREMAEKVLAACPDAEWRLIFALSRYGGLRCPSEHLALTWAGVDWERNRLLVPSPKTEHHEGGAERWIPLFPELRPYLEEAFDRAEDGAVYVVSRCRASKVNLRTGLQRIIHKAGMKPWPKLFHNLRASRETELAETWPIHVVCAWIGNTALIAAKHYLQVTDDHFERATARAAESGAVALQNPVQHVAATLRIVSQETTQPREGCGVARESTTPCETMQIDSAPTRTRTYISRCAFALRMRCSRIELAVAEAFAPGTRFHLHCRRDAFV